MTHEQSVLVALVPVAVLVAVHLSAERVRRASGRAEAAVVSVAGGVSVAYVFLHLLPEVAAGAGPIGTRVPETIQVTLPDEVVAFAVALAGFTVFYGLERWAESSGSPRQHDGGAAVNDDRAGGRPSAATFGVHLGAFAAYNVGVAYTLAPRVADEVLGAALFTIAIAVHVLVVDRGLSAHYPGRFHRVGRFLLSGALLLGWAWSALSPEVSVLAVSLLTAAVAGTVLLTVFKEELPSARRSRFGWFALGLVVYSAVLITLATVTPVHLGE